jgi:hypothetical protein
MPNRDDLIVHLSGVRINITNGNDRRRVSTVAGHLVTSIYKDEWNQLSEQKKRLTIRNSADRLWNNYMQRRTTLEQLPKEAANDAITDELSNLEKEHSSTVRFSKEDIGGEILPILTRGLYSNLLDTLREYVQNAIDAQCKKIYLTINTDIISVEDDGTGMTGPVARKAIRLGM